MVFQSDGNSALAYRSALEALRNGVPNGEAVRILGCNQPQAEAEFSELLAKAGDAATPPESAMGMLVSGDFGTGKSHLLTYLEGQALDRGFVCSKVVISKETPLFDLGKVFKSAVESGRMPDHSGRLMEELGLALKPGSQAYDQFYRWAHETDRLSQIFPASLRVHEDSSDSELNHEIEGFWGGDRIRVARVKGGLRQVRQLQSYSFTAQKVADLPPQRMRFATELIKAAGYKGWVVLLDEIELVGSYSLLQRGRSYSELARWMGQVVGEAHPGLVVVGTVTDDFATAIIDPAGTKKDRDYVPARLQARFTDIVARAETGMRLLERQSMRLNPPTDDDVQRTIEKLREAYRVAYQWDAPRLGIMAGGVGFQNRMRYKVRSAINEWDLMRVYPNSRPDTVSDEYRPTYEENLDLERESKDDAGDGC